MSRKPGRAGKGRTQQIKKGGVGERTICLKAVPLEEQKSLTGGGGFHLRDQARFANARLTRHEGDLALSAPGLLKKLRERNTFGYAANKDRAND